MTVRILAFAAVFFLLTACSKDNSSQLDGDWIFPIARGSVSLNSLNELKNISYRISVPALSIGQPTNVPVSSPGLQIAHVGPFPLQLSSWLHRLDIDSMEVNGSLDNIFPIPIGAGTKVSVRNSRDTVGNGNVLGSTVIASDIAPGSLVNFTFKFSNKTVGDSVYFFLDDFTSPPYSNVVFTSAPTELNVTLKVITANYVEIYANRSFSSIDTVSFSAGSDDQVSNNTGGTVSDTGVSGTINLFLDNSFPANITTQLYFMNEDKNQIIDSLFTSPFLVTGAQTDALGNPQSTISTVNKMTITRKRIENIKKAKFAITNFKLNTAGYSSPWVSANKNAKLAIQLTGDLNIKINF